MPTISSDYMFRSDRQENNEEKGMATMFMVDDLTEVTFSNVMIIKGVCVFRCMGFKGFEFTGEKAS